MSQPVNTFLDYVRQSPTAFHAVETGVRALKDKGFQLLQEGHAWNIVPGGSYVVTRNRSAAIALRIPDQGAAPFQIVASHADSPMFKLKPVFEDLSCGQYLRLNVEPYGGMLMSTWLDRPLSVAGRLLIRTPDGLKTCLVDLSRDALVIPNQPIHFNREANDGYKYNAQVDLLPLWGGAEDQGKLLQELCSACGASAEDVAGYDLYLYNRMPGTVWGAEQSFFSSPRIDDLECAWTSLQALLEAKPGNQIQVWALMDNEEVGSSSKQGADSSFLSDTLHRVLTSLGCADSEARSLIASSFMVSADNAHAVHPNHPEKYDAENRVWMNGGIVIKHSANQKYTTDAVSCAVFSEICRKAGVRVQHFANRSDLRGGSTLGNIANTHTSMNTVDIGLAQLAMHSSWETAGVQDLPDMIHALQAYYETELRMQEDGLWQLK